MQTKFDIHRSPSGLHVRMWRLHKWLFIMWIGASVQVSAQDTLQVEWATYLGGSGDDQMRDLCVDKADNVYVCGVFTSPDFPKPLNVPTSTDTAGPGGYLASFSPDGQLRWLQYFNCVRPHELDISDEGVLVMVGVSAEACGRVDAVVATFNMFGERVSGEAYLGGSGVDIATTVDIVGNTIYVGGITKSTDFPILRAFQPSYLGDGPGANDKGDGFIAKLDLLLTPNGWILLPDVTTYFGGRYLDEILVLRIRDSDGGILVGGRTRSDKLPENPFVQTVRPGSIYDDDGFVALLDSGSVISRWSMFCGGLGNDVVYGLQAFTFYDNPPVDTAQFVRVCGTFNGGNFAIPGQPGNSARFEGGTSLGGDAFFFELAEDQGVVVSTRQISTLADDIVTSFPRTTAGNLGPLLFSNGQINGLNPPSNFDAYRWNVIVPPGMVAIPQEFRGSGDELTLDAEQARFGFGGNDAGPGASYICGSTTSILMPGTNAPGPIFQRTKVGNGRNGFLAKMSGCKSRTARLTASDSVLCATGESSILSLQPEPLVVRWRDGETSPTRLVLAPGRYEVTYSFDGYCEIRDAIEIRAGVIPNGYITPADTVGICDTSGVLLRVNSNKRVQHVVWSNGVSTQDTTLRVRTPGRYSALLISSDGCIAQTDTVTVVSSSPGGSTPLLLSYAGADSAKVGSIVRVVLRFAAPAGTDVQSLPTSWSVNARFNKTMLFPARPLGKGTTDDSMRTVKIAGTRNPSSDTLGFFELRVALGDRDSTSIIVDSLVFDPCLNDPVSISLPFKTAGVCRIDSTGRFITFRRSKLVVAVASNPVGPDGAIASAVGDELSGATARVVSILGQEIPLGTGDTYGDSMDWTIPSWLPVGTYVLIVQSQTSVASTLFEVVR